MFGFSVVLFIVLLVYGGILYLNYNEPTTQNGMTVEVNLPVIDWQKYQNLSKHY